jgi:tetratricopeptide (TPR) repeat protein
MPEAIIEYRRAVQTDPMSGEARMKLAEAYSAIGDIGNALPHAVRGGDLLADNVDVQLKVASILLSAARYEEAISRADKILALAPNHSGAQVIRAYGLGGLNRIEEAVKEVEAAIARNPNEAFGYANLGAMEMVRGDRDKAEAAFKRAVALAPKSAEARLALGYFYLASGRAAEAEPELKAALAANPKDPVANRALAFYYLGKRRPSDAEPLLKVVAETSPDVSGMLLLADFYTATQRVGDARRVLEQASSRPEGFAPARLRLASLGWGDRAAAEKLVEEVLARQPNQLDALLVRTRLRLADNKLDDALAVVDAAVKAHPESSQAHLVLGQVYVRRGQPDQARTAFNAALRINPRFALAEIELARLHMGAGQFDEAERLAISALRKNLGYAEAHLLLAQVYLRTGRPQRAEPSLRLLATALPDSPIVQAQVGHMELTRGNHAAARAAYGRVLARDPESVDALTGLVEVELQAKNINAARARLKDALTRAPRHSRILMLAGTTETRAGDRAAAERHFRAAIDADPDNMDAYLSLARLYGAQGRIPETIAQVEAVAQKQATSVAAQTLLGILYHYKNRVAEAKTQYERALALDASAAVASNNLAWILAESGQDLEYALRLAQTAKAKLPERHEVSDTLGWVQIKRGMGALAVAPLREAAEQQPDNPTYHYHLGLAYMAAKNFGPARTSFQKALSLNPEFDGAADARRALAELR